MSYYLKHPQHGNRHVETFAEFRLLLAEGWVQWPRSKSQKETVVTPVALPTTEISVPVQNKRGRKKWQR